MLEVGLERPAFLTALYDPTVDLRVGLELRAILSAAFPIGDLAIFLACFAID
jgi:hypothetical protein